MIGLLQRVTQAQVDVASETVGRIEGGLLVLVGVQPQDNEAHAERLLQRVRGYRVFADGAGKMNLSLEDMGGGLLLVPQFTLTADTAKGMRPSFTLGAPPQQARHLFEYLVALAREQGARVESGVFGADMQVSLVNDGPVTFWLQV